MFEKKLKDLLVLVEGNEQVIENAVAKFSYTYNIAKEMVDVYNYIVKTLEDCNVELPVNIVKIDTASFGQDCKEIFEIISYRNIEAQKELCISQIKKYHNGIFCEKYVKISIFPRGISSFFSIISSISCSAKLR